MHNAAKLLPTAVANWISSVVIFGDPGKHSLVNTQFSVLIRNR